MVIGQSVDAVEVGDDDSAEMPAVAQQAGQEFFVAGGRNAVDAVIGSHDRQGAFVDGGLERGQEILGEVPFSDEGGVAVVASLGNAVCDEMLEGRSDTFVIAVVQRAGAAHHAGSHRAGEVDVFTIGFFDTGPAGLPCQVDDRSVTDVAALGPEFGRDDPSGLFHQGRIPGRGKADAGREYGGSDGHVAVRRFFGQDDRDAEAAVFDRVALQGVIGLGGQGRIEAVFQGLAGPGVCPERRPQHAAVLLVDEFPEGFRFRHDGLFRSRLFIHRPAERADDLSDLLLGRHASQEVRSPFLAAPARIFIDFRTVSACRHQDKCQDGGDEQGGKREKSRFGSDRIGKWF